MDIAHSFKSGTPPDKMSLVPVVAANTTADTSARVLVQSTTGHIAAKIVGMSKLIPTRNKSGKAIMTNTHRYHDLVDLAIFSEVATVSLADLKQSWCS